MDVKLDDPIYPHSVPGANRIDGFSLRTVDTAFSIGEIAAEIRACQFCQAAFN